MLSGSRPGVFGGRWDRLAVGHSDSALPSRLPVQLQAISVEVFTCCCPLSMLRSGVVGRGVFLGPPGALILPHDAALNLATVARFRFTQLPLVDYGRLSPVIVSSSLVTQVP